MRDARIAGMTFTGSVAVGRAIMSEMASGAYPRPCIAEMGGKNPAIVTENADLDRAATGIARSAYGMGGQKCSALSRLYVHEKVADDAAREGREADRRDPDRRPDRARDWLGPVVNKRAHECYARYVADLKSRGAKLRRGGRAAVGGRVRARLLRRAGARRGAAVRSAVAAGDVPADPDGAALSRPRRGDAPRERHGHGPHRRLLRRGRRDRRGSRTTSRRASPTRTAAQGATTGAWPGYQPFGGWKGSGSSGKAIASSYYLPLYLREQSRTVVE